MLIKHEFKNKKIEKEIKDPGFLITNRNGSYYSDSLNKSRYDGFFIYEKNEMYRVLDEIVVNDDINEISNKFSSLKLKRNKLNQEIFMFKNFNTLICLFDKFALIELLFDVKKSYDNREYGRFYTITHENDKIIIKFDKKTSSLDKEAEGNFEYSLFIVINQATFSTPNAWVKKSYKFDKERNSMPHERYVFHGLKLLTNKLIITASLDKKKAINENSYVKKHLHDLILKNEKNVIKLLSRFKHRNKEIDFALKCSINSLYQLSTENGVFAGLPWFFQCWARDELLSLKSLNLFNRHLGNQILNRHIENLIRKNRLYSNEKSDLIAKDALGLLALRSFEIKNFNYKLINYLRNNINSPSLIKNSALETWMDTDVFNDKREGFRIEIQSLYLNICSILYKITKDEKFKFFEEALKFVVRKNFFTGKILKDGLNDATIRPNIFLAYYYYPELLTKKEWINVFHNSLPNIWNNWGGFSSIEKSSLLFQPNNTGENNLSYHRGDSWFYLNNIAAICLLRLSKKNFSKYIKKILSASIQDILWNGYIGFHSEISSSSKLEAKGCKAQAWSSAMFIELINEFKK